MRAPKSSTEYQFKISLKGSRRASRTIALRGDQTLDDLHEAIFAAFDRFDPHLYSFYFPKGPSRRGRTGPQPKEYTASQMFDEPDALDGDRRFDASETKLDDLRLRPGQRFEYLFDFGDAWWHAVAVEGINPIVSRSKYPRFLESRGKSPPQYEVVDE